MKYPRPNPWILQVLMKPLLLGVPLSQLQMPNDELGLWLPPMPRFRRPSTDFSGWVNGRCSSHCEWSGAEPMSVFRPIDFPLPFHLSFSRLLLSSSVFILKQSSTRCLFPPLSPILLPRQEREPPLVSVLPSSIRYFSFSPFFRFFVFSLTSPRSYGFS